MSHQNVVVVEGEFDAMSVIEAGNDAIALGSTTNVDRFLTWLKENEVHPNKPMIIDSDDDDAGKAAVAKLIEGLRGQRIKY